MDKISDIITGLGLIVAAVVGLIVSFIKGRTEIQNTLPQKIKKQSCIDVGIIEKMEELKEFVNADRVQLYDFHNGGHYANGRSALKTSCTYEVVRTGIMPSQRLLQDIPISCISKFTATLLDNGCMEVSDIEQIKDTMVSTYQLKKDLGITSFFDITICNSYGEAIGFLAVQYIKNKYCCCTEKEKQAVLKLKFFIEEELAKTVSK